MESVEKQEIVKRILPENTAKPTHDYGNPEITRALITAEIFKHYQTVMALIISAILGFLISQVWEIRGHFKYIEKIDDFYEVKAQNERVIEENRKLENDIRLLKEQAHIRRSR